jgi:predicted membrane chloride channel (bestrophin family)
VGDPLNNRHSASDWLYNVRSFPQSKVLREIRNPVLTVAAWSLVVSVVHRVCQSSQCAVLQAAASHMSIPGTAHSFLVSALGLLLVFRTNSAYQRFNVSTVFCMIWCFCISIKRLTYIVIMIVIRSQEGRKIWENILSVSRNMSRMLQLYSTEVGPEKQRRITNLVAAYPYLLRQHIRPGCLCSDAEIPAQHRLLLQEHRHVLHETRHEGQDAQSVAAEAVRKDCWVDKRALPWSLFLPQSLPAIARAENRPLWVCDRMAALIATIPYGPNFTSRERLVLLGMVDKLTNAVGQCERIHQTAVPLNYARHSLRSLTLWLFTLPFALVSDLGLFTAPANAAIAWLFFGVYQIGYSIEDPFQGSLRLSILCDAIRRSVVRQTADMRDSAYQLDDFDDNEQQPQVPDEPKELKDSMRRSVLLVREDEQQLQRTASSPEESTTQQSLTEKIQQDRLTEDCLTMPLQEEIQQQLLSGDYLPEPLLFDEELLNAPKIVRRINGTWTEVGI